MDDDDIINETVKELYDWSFYKQPFLHVIPEFNRQSRHTNSF